MSTQTFTSTATISTRVYNYGYYPLLKGNFAPLFHFNNEAFVSLQHYLDLQQPLVVAFYDGFNQNLQSYNALLSLQVKVLENGGNLIVVTNNTTRAFQKGLSNLNNLTVFFDIDNEISEKFGLYDAENPLTNWVSGVDDANTTIPAIYVIAPDRQIVFHHIDYQLSLFRNATLSNSVVEGLLDAVGTLATSYGYLSRWSKQLVS
jgi:hypothetical protein